MSVTENKVDTKLWVARIKWYDDKVETVSIKRIKSFSPTHLKDFDKTRWYRVKGDKKDYIDEVPHSGYALVGKLWESRALSLEYTDRKRVTFPKLLPPDEDPESTASEAERMKKTYGTSMQQAQEKTQILKNSKKVAHAESFSRFTRAFLTDSSSNTNQVQDNLVNKQNYQDQNVDPEKNKDLAIAAMAETIKKLKKEKQELERIVKAAQPTNGAKNGCTVHAELVTEVKELRNKVDNLSTYISKSDVIFQSTRTKTWVEMHYGSTLNIM